MKHTFFEIKNVKGINHVRLDFEVKPQSNVYTLVGLNESGKTTILEAIDYLNIRPEKTPDLPNERAKNPRDLIPINQRGNFNGIIEIQAGFKFEEEDKKKLRTFLKDELECELVDDVGIFTANKKFTFENSETQKSQPESTWSLIPNVRRPDGKVELLHLGETGSKD